MLIPIAVLTFVISVVILYTVEFFSKSFFIINSNKMVRAMALPFLVLFTILFPLVFTVISLAKLIINKVFGLEYSKERPVFGLTDVNQYLKSLHRIKYNDRDLAGKTRQQVDRSVNKHRLSRGADYLTRSPLSFLTFAGLAFSSSAQ